MSSNFSFDTITDFEKHIEASVPGYSQLNDYLVSISAYFLNNSTVIDIGCSTGMLLNKLSFHYPNNRFIGLDISENLFNQAKISDAIELKEHDLIKNDLPEADLYFSIFTLQFLPVATRAKILQQSFELLPKGGAFIVAEKVFANNGRIQDILNFSHYDYKEKNFSSSEIFNKQKDLRLLMKPLTELENESLFKNAGFAISSPFWQNLLFKAWILIK